MAARSAAGTQGMERQAPPGRQARPRRASSCVCVGVPTGKGLDQVLQGHVAAVVVGGTDGHLDLEDHGGEGGVEGLEVVGKLLQARRDDRGLVSQAKAPMQISCLRGLR